MKWQIKAPDQISNLDELKKILLTNRHLDLESDLDFFSPPHPRQLSLNSVDIKEKSLLHAQQLIQSAIDHKQKILIFGDYDADGICSTAVIWETLYQLGMKAQVFIPHRKKHGYGLSVTALAEIFAKDKPDLIITVDNGIVAHPALEFAKQAGVKVIVTDHHQADQEKLEAEEVIHSTALAGAGVAWFLSQTLIGRAADQLLDLVVLATIADQVPVLKANRSFVFHGLPALAKTQRLGLQALLKVAGLNSGKLDSFQVAFMLAPRINAMGRLDYGLPALQLLCTRNKDRAATLAIQLNQTNQERQNLTYDALTQVEKHLTLGEKDKLLLVFDPSYNPGVIGLIAGKLVEKYARPTLVMTKVEGVIKGSARSVEGIDITTFLRKFSKDFLELGGHSMAAGFAFNPDLQNELFIKLQTQAQQDFADELLVANLVLEAKLDPQLLNLELLDLLDTFKPFGQANQAPLFALFKLKLLDKQYLGKNQEHLKLIFAYPDQEAKTLKTLFWQQGEIFNQLKLAQSYDLAVSLERNVWNGKSSLQAVVKDLKTEL